MLFSVRSAGDREAEFKVVMREESRRITTLIPGASQATYLGNNQLAYQTGSTLMLADFDRSAGVLSNPRKVIDGVYATAHGASWAIAGNTLVYRPVEPPRRRLVWVERAGRMTPIDSELRDFSNPKISPSGDRVVTAVQQQNGTRNLWILDLTRQTLTPLTTGAQTMGGLWTSDGSAIAATRTNGAALDVILQAADGSTASRVLLHTGEQNYVADLDATSRLMVVMAQVGKTGRDIAVMDRDDPSTLRYIVETPATEFGGRLSPNGKWLSYFSDTSGRYELWVTPFPQGGPKWQLTRNGAREAVWSHDGRELYFRQGDTMNAITIHDTPTFSWDPAHELFTGVFFQLGGPGNVHYDVAKDGRFLMIQEAPPRTPSFNVVRNWQQLAK